MNPQKIPPTHPKAPHHWGAGGQLNPRLHMNSGSQTLGASFTKSTLSEKTSSEFSVPFKYVKDQEGQKHKQFPSVIQTHFPPHPRPERFPVTVPTVPRADSNSCFHDPPRRTHRSSWEAEPLLVQALLAETDKNVRDNLLTYWGARGAGNLWGGKAASRRGRL